MTSPSSELLALDAWLEQHDPTAHEALQEAVRRGWLSVTGGGRKPRPPLVVRCQATGGAMVTAGRTPAGMVMVAFRIRESDLYGKIEVDGRLRPVGPFRRRQSSGREVFEVVGSSPDTVTVDDILRHRARQDATPVDDPLVWGSAALPWPADLPQPTTLACRCPRPGTHVVPLAELTARAGTPQEARQEWKIPHHAQRSP